MLASRKASAQASQNSGFRWKFTSPWGEDFFFPLSNRLEGGYSLLLLNVTLETSICCEMSNVRVEPYLSTLEGGDCHQGPTKVLMLEVESSIRISRAPTPTFGCPYFQTSKLTGLLLPWLGRILLVFLLPRSIFLVYTQHQNWFLTLRWPEGFHLWFSLSSFSLHAISDP